jgi:hypothetical protein
VYDVFVASDDDHALFGSRTPLGQPDSEAEPTGIHGILFCQLPQKRGYYPTLKDEEAQNPDGSRIRR